MLQGLIYALFSAAAFGSMAILVKLGYQAGMNGAEMMEYRFSYAVILMLLILLVKDRTLLRIPRRNLAGCAFIGLIIYWLQTTCFVSGLETIPASTAALVLYVHPVTVALLSAMFLGMKLDRTVTATLVLVMGGCCLVFYDAFLKAVDPLGLAYATGAMVFFSCYLVLVQVLLKGVRPLTATFYVMLFAAVSFNISGAMAGAPLAWLMPEPETFFIGLALGVVPGVIAVTFLYLSIEKVGSSYACIFSSIEPVVTLAAAAAYLDENVVLLQVAGAALIILGIIIPNARTQLLRKRLEI